MIGGAIIVAHLIRRVLQESSKKQIQNENFENNSTIYMVSRDSLFTILLAECRIIVIICRSFFSNGWNIYGGDFYIQLSTTIL